MIQYNIDFFDRKLEFKDNDQDVDLSIDDDYLTITTNRVTVKRGAAVETGDFIRIERGDASFFGVVSNVSPGELSTIVDYKPFVSLFDENIFFDVRDQYKTVKQSGSSKKINAATLENTIKKYITDYYISSGDSNQNMNLIVSVGSQTPSWTLGIYSDNENIPYSIRSLYKDILVTALKQYGIAINVVPDFDRKQISLVISKNTYTLDVDGDLSNVNVKTLKYNDKPNGTNKLEVYDATTYNPLQKVTFYVHPDRTWDLEDKNRITPVVRNIRMVMPDSETEDPAEAFAIAALDAADSELSGLQWDNLIELEAMPNDELIDPLNLEFGQPVSLWYQNGRYESILTGRTINSDSILLTFGSERIKFTKRIKL